VELDLPEEPVALALARGPGARTGHLAVGLAVPGLPLLQEIELRQ